MLLAHYPPEKKTPHRRGRSWQIRGRARNNTTGVEDSGRIGWTFIDKEYSSLFSNKRHRAEGVVCAAPDTWHDVCTTCYPTGILDILDQRTKVLNTETILSQTRDKWKCLHFEIHAESRLWPAVDNSFRRMSGDTENGGHCLRLGRIINCTPKQYDPSSMYDCSYLEMRRILLEYCRCDDSL